MNKQHHIPERRTNVVSLDHKRTLDRLRAGEVVEEALARLEADGVPPFVTREILADALIRRQPANPWREPADIAAMAADFWFFTLTRNRLDEMADALRRALARAGHDPYEHP